jgi:hypothetical protein
MDLTQITTPFGLLNDETRAALKAHGGPYEFWKDRETWGNIEAPSWSGNLVYRVKPQPPTKPSIDWSHVAPEYKWLARDDCDNAYLYAGLPSVSAYCSEWVANCDAYAANAFAANAFASYTPGTCDWRDSLVQRPEDV